jgi:hypothetical protein
VPYELCPQYLDLSTEKIRKIRFTSHKFEKTELSYKLIKTPVKLTHYLKA